MDTNANRADYYVYVLFRENGVPFYIGKGTRGRWTEHEKKSQIAIRGYKNAIIRGMHARGIEVPKMKLHEGLTEAVAHDYEIALIAALGRYPNGPLANRTCGGEGVSGLRHTPETLAKLSVASRGRVASAETRKKISAANIGKKMSAESVAKRANAIRGRKLSAAHIAKMAASKRGKRHSAEHIAKISAAARNRPPISLVVRANMSAAQRGRTFSVETLDKMSKAQIGKPWSEKRRAKSPRVARLPPALKTRKTMSMDTRVTKSVRLVPERWQIVFDLQEARGLSSMGAAVDVIVDWWEATKPMRQRIAEREKK